MTYAICNCYPLQEKMAVTIDALVIISTIALVALTFANIGHTEHLKYHFCMAGSLLIAGIVIADITSYLKKNRIEKRDLSKEVTKVTESPTTMETEPALNRALIESMRDKIQSARHVMSFDEESLRIEATKTPCHKVLGELWLGNFQSFIELLGIDRIAFTPFEDGSPEWVFDVNNSKQFKSVITLNDVVACFTTLPDKCQGGESINLETIKKSFNDGIIWHDLSVKDLDSDAWGQLIRKCAKLTPSDPLPSVQEWFEPIFQEMDKAVSGEIRTLIHCFAGISRSTCLVVAYMIKRFDVSAAQAVIYLKSIRYCVKPHLMSELEKYEKALKTGNC